MGGRTPPASRRPGARSDYLQIGDDGEKSLVWWVGDLRRPRPQAEYDEWVKARRIVTTVGGPYLGEELIAKLIGRVVGVAFSPLGNVLDAVAGWVDEDRYNAEFDAAEYVDITLAYGDMLLARLDPNGAPVSEEERQMVYVVREAYARASKAKEMVALESMRRGPIAPDGAAA
jgi:hypothetical protein